MTGSEKRRRQVLRFVIRRLARRIGGRVLAGNGARVESDPLLAQRMTVQGTERRGSFEARAPRGHLRMAGRPIKSGRAPDDGRVKSG